MFGTGFREIALPGAVRFLFWILVGWQGRLILWLLKALPWWVFFVLSYFTITQVGPEYQKYKTEVSKVATDSDAPRVQEVAIDAFDAALHVGPNDEVLVKARWNKGLPVLYYDGVSVLDFVVLPLVSNSEGVISGVAVCPASERDKLLAYFRDRVNGHATLVLHGRLGNAPIPAKWIEKELVLHRERLADEGYSIAEGELPIFRPYLEGRQTELVRAARVHRFWAFTLLLLGGGCTILGAVKLWRSRLFQES